MVIVLKPDISIGIFSPRIWESLVKFSLLGQIPRTGYVIWGNASGETKMRPESVLEHSAILAAFFGLLALYYPDSVIAENLQLFLMMALFHDAGEVEVGDIPKCRGKTETEKASERKAFLKFINELGVTSPLRAELVALYDEKENRSTERGQILYCADSIMAILGGLFYKKLGRPSDIKSRLDYSDLNQVEEKIIAALKTDNQLDLWAGGFFIRVKPYLHLRMCSVMMEVLYVAMKDVYEEEPFVWIDDLPSDLFT